MAKEELLEFDGTVTEVLPDGNFRVKLDNEHEVLAYTAGKMRKFRIRTGVGDRVVRQQTQQALGRLLRRRLVVRKRRKRAGENDRQRECETQQSGCRHGQTLKNSLAPGSLRPLTAAEVRPALLRRR